MLTHLIGTHTRLSEQSLTSQSVYRLDHPSEYLTRGFLILRAKEDDRHRALATLHAQIFTYTSNDGYEAQYVSSREAYFRYYCGDHSCHTYFSDHTLRGASVADIAGECPLSPKTSGAPWTAVYNVQILFHARRPR